MKYYFQCPRCGNDESFTRPKPVSATIASLNGFTGWLMIRNYENHQVQCARCLREFQPPGLPTTSLGKFAAWLFFSTLLLTIAAPAVFSFKELRDSLPVFPGSQFLEDTIALAPRVAAYWLLSLTLLIVISSVVAAVGSHYFLRRKLARTHRLKPDPAPLPLPAPPAEGKRIVQAS